MNGGKNSRKEKETDKLIVGLFFLAIFSLKLMTQHKHVPIINILYNVSTKYVNVV